jgi:SPP1 gp7 family putative phage head morphogenesis protein
MTANDELLNKEIGHAIDLLGYSNSVSRNIIKLLNRADNDLFDKLTAELNKVTPSPEKINRINALLKSVNNLNSQTYSQVSDQLTLDLQKFTSAEVTYQQNLIANAQPLKVLPIAPEAVYSAAMALPFQGKLLGEFMSGLELQKATLIKDAVRIGFIESQTTGEIVNRIRGTRALKYTDGIINITRNNAESVVLTAIAHHANVAQTKVYEANEDIIKGYRYTATLDTRTTELCASRDGKFYKLGDKKPALPAHFRCRSRYVAVLKSFKEMGLDVTLPESTRASLDGQVPAKTSYQDWLRKQPVDRQNEILGVTKANIFREGALQLDKFVSPAGHVYTLDELKIRNAKQFYLGTSIDAKDLRKLSPDAQSVLRDMYEKAAENKNSFDKNVVALSQTIGAEAKIANLKKTGRTVEKILADYKGDPTQVKDLLRSTILVNSLSEVDIAIKSIQNKFGTAIKLRNSLAIGSKALDGYRDVNMVVKYNGSLAEVQINLNPMIEVKSIYHKEYEKIRSLDAKAVDEKRDLTSAEEAIRKAAVLKMENGYNVIWAKIVRENK